jgi:type I restriction enzyme S subunit
LSAIDDRINGLHQTNATLEAIAQALFKSWFVDFDPVRAKAEGREPEGIPPEVADLFPSEFEDTALGDIPKGWRAMRLDQACDINPTRRLSKATVAPYLEMAAVPTRGHRPDAPVPRAFSSGTKFINGDTLLARITPCLENGKTTFVDFLSDGETGWGSTEYIVLRPNSPLPTYWAYLLCRHDPFRKFAIQAMVGTSGRQRVEVSRLAQFPVNMPGEQVATAFAAIVEAIQAKIAANDNEAKTLAELRDTLLPRLMSGKLRIPEAACPTA